MTGGGRRFRHGDNNGNGFDDPTLADIGSDMSARIQSGAREVGRRTRGWWLLVPVPMLSLALIVKAFGQDWTGLLAVAFALYAIFQGWWMIRRGLNVAAQDQHRAIHPGRFPWRLLGAKVVGSAAFGLAFVFATQESGLVLALFQAFVVDMIVTAALVIAFGIDKIAANGLAEAAASAGIPQSDLVKAFREADNKINRLERAAAGTANPNLRSQLFAIAASAKRVVRLIEEDPKDLRRARRFLATYLDSATRIADDFQQKQSTLTDTQLAVKYAALLDTITQTFAEQEDKLARNDHLDLDVRIDVLKTQMEREGL